MKKKKWILPVSIVGGVIVLCVIAVFAFGAIQSAKGFGISTGRLYGMLKVQDLDGNGSLLAAQKVDFDVQYIRTGTQNYEGPFPAVAVVHSTDELAAYYEANKDQFDLERREDYGSDFTIGYLDACNKYDAKFFENNALVFIVLEEGSGSTRHNIESVKVDADGIMYVNILSIDPEVGTCDMAYWHIMTEVSKDMAPDTAEDVVVYYNDIKMYDGHPHSPANEAQTMEAPVFGYCGNMQTTVYFDKG